MSSTLEKNLAAIKQHQDTYQPNNEVAKALSSKTLVMVVAPPAIGKTTVMKRVAELNQDFGRTSVFTTRPQRTDDEPGLVRTVPNTPEGTDLILQKIANRDLVQFAVHPTQHTIYGTELSDYPSHNNLLATLSGAVHALKNLPFRSTTTVGLVAEPTVYKRWFLERYPINTDERQKRAREAVLSLTWLLQQPEGEIVWLTNHDNELDTTAHTLIELSSGATSGDTQSRQLAEYCITMVEQFA